MYNIYTHAQKHCSSNQRILVPQHVLHMSIKRQKNLSVSTQQLVAPILYSQSALWPHSERSRQWSDVGEAPRSRSDHWVQTQVAWSADSNTVLSFPVSTLNNILEAWSMDSRGLVCRHQGLGLWTVGAWSVDIRGLVYGQ